MKPAASFGTEPEDVARAKAEELTRKIMAAAKAEEAEMLPLPNTEDDIEVIEPKEQPPVAPAIAPSPAKRESPAKAKSRPDSWEKKKPPTSGSVSGTPQKKDPSLLSAAKRKASPNKKPPMARGASGSRSSSKLEDSMIAPTPVVKSNTIIKENPHKSIKKSEEKLTPA